MNGKSKSPESSPAAEGGSERERDLERRLQEALDENRRLKRDNERLEYEATHDHLTGILNRLGFERAAQSALKGEAPEIPPGAPRMRTPAEGQPDRKEIDFSKSCLLLFDLDHFKAINDALGHAVGDDALEVVANHWRENLREYDIFGRRGGDEFVIIFRGVNAEDLRNRFAKNGGDASVSFPVRMEGQTIELSLSGGLVDINPGENRSLRDIIREADEALYVAKREGRDRILTAEKAKKVKAKLGS